MNTVVCDMLGIRYPILQGGMAWIADSSLASAVSNAGGLGIIAAANAPVGVVRDEIRRAKALTDKPFGVNIMLLSPSADEIARLVIDEGVRVVTTGAGNPEKYVPMWKEAGIKVIPVIASVAHAKRMERIGADMIIAEGLESGGHIGENTTMAMVPMIVDSVSIPVIAAGGVGDGRGMAACFMLGACGVQIGTRFLVAKECNVHDNYKGRVLKAKDIDSVVTARSSGHPVRSIRNSMTRKYLQLEKDGACFEELESLTIGSLKNAAIDGDVINGTVMAGLIAGLVSKEQSCKEIIDEIIVKADELLKVDERQKEKELLKDELQKETELFKDELLKVDERQKEKELLKDELQKETELFKDELQEEVELLNV